MAVMCNWISLHRLDSSRQRSQGVLLRQLKLKNYNLPTAPTQTSSNTVAMHILNDQGMLCDKSCVRINYTNSNMLKLFPAFRSIGNGTFQ